jgi:hypothetical protein
VCREQLAEGHEECDLDRYGAGDDGKSKCQEKMVSTSPKRAVCSSSKYVRPALASRDCEHEDHDSEREQVGKQGDHSQELSQLRRGPCSLKVSSAIEDREAGNSKCEYVRLDERCCDECPRVDDGQRRHQGQIRDDDVRICRPLTIPNCSVEDGLKQQDGKERPRNGRHVESGSHGEAKCCSLRHEDVFSSR